MADSVHIKLGQPQALQLSIFLWKNHLYFTTMWDLFKDPPLRDSKRKMREKAQQDSNSQLLDHES